MPLPVEGGRTLYFDTGSSDVEKQFREDIRQIAERMLGNPNLVVTLEGHSDNVGNADDNKRLSYHRAMSIQIALLDKYGIVASRIKVSGYGEERPAASNFSREGRRLNRRVEVRLHQDTGTGPCRAYSSRTGDPCGSENHSLGSGSD